MTSDDIGSRTRYAALRDELDRLRREFARQRGDHGRLFAQRFWDAEQLADGGWEAFAHRAARPQSWEGWHVLAGGEGVIRLYGDHTCLDDFTRLAESGWLALAALGQSPEPGLVTLGNDGHLCGWMNAVFETALAAMTPTLRLDYERWGLDDEDVADLNELTAAYWHGEGDDRHPAHPCVQTLGRDLFTSSADAVACWLDPANVLTVVARLDDLPIRLPSLDVPRPDDAKRPEEQPQASREELSTREAAIYLNVSVDTLNAHVRAGRLPRRNVSPHGSSRGPFLYKVADLAKLRDGAYRRTLPRGEPKRAKTRRATSLPPEQGYDHLDL